MAEVPLIFTLYFKKVHSVEECVGCKDMVYIGVNVLCYKIQGEKEELSETSLRICNACKECFDADS